MKMSTVSGCQNFQQIGKWKRCLLIAACISGLLLMSTTSDFNYTCIVGGLSEKTSFVNAMRNFPWGEYRSAVKWRNTQETQVHSTNLLLKIIPYLVLPPKIRESWLCKEPSLPSPHLSGHKCHRLSKPRRVGVLLQFGFDVDALEIHFHELDAIVDKFFLLESIQAHSSKITSKPLLWDSLKRIDRFKKFVDKVVHFVVDDGNLVAVSGSMGVFGREAQQEALRWQKFLEWNNVTNYFGTSDLLGFGDVDEVPWRNNIVFLKNCEMPADPVDIGIWFPFNGMDSAFSTDFPVSGHPYTLGDPTYWTVGAAKNYFIGRHKIPNRNRGGSGGYLLGGMHLSRYAYPPFQMTKLLTPSENGWEEIERLIRVGTLYAENETAEANEILNSVPSKLEVRTQTLSEFKALHGSAEAEAVIKIPWFLSCNPNRYPGFYGKHDSRLSVHT